MEQGYYGPEEGGIRRHFEAAIPILIILLLILGVVALKPEWMADIPLIGDFFQKPIKILVIPEEETDKQIWTQTLQADAARAVLESRANIEYLLPEDFAMVNSEDWFVHQGYDVVILSRGAHHEGDVRGVPEELQIYLANWVTRKGGRMVVTYIGGLDANGNWNKLKTVLPVSCGGNPNCFANDRVRTVTNPRLLVEDWGNTLGNRLGDRIVHWNKLMQDSDDHLNLLEVIPNKFPIINLQEEAEDGTLVYLGVAERGDPLTGKVVYMSFNPAHEAGLKQDAREALIVHTVAHVLGR
jgi:hypothetical protein